MLWTSVRNVVVSIIVKTQTCVFISVLRTALLLYYFSTTWIVGLFTKIQLVIRPNNAVNWRSGLQLYQQTELMKTMSE